MVRPPTREGGPTPTPAPVPSAVAAATASAATAAEAAPAAPQTVHQLSSWQFRRFVVLCCILMANAGWTNAIAMTTVNSTISHMTGITTRIGWELSDTDSPDWVQIRCDLLSVFGYLFGVITAGLIIGPAGKFALSWRYAVCFGVESLLLYLCGAQAMSWAQPAYALKTLLAYSMGVQNGVTTIWSGGMGRSTHVTGFIADIGVMTAQLLYSCANVDPVRLGLFVPLYLSFFLGALFGGLIHRATFATALYGPATVALLFGCATLFHGWLLRATAPGGALAHSPLWCDAAHVIEHGFASLRTKRLTQGMVAAGLPDADAAAAADPAPAVGVAVVADPGVELAAPAVSAAAPARRGAPATPSSRRSRSAAEQAADEQEKQFV